MNRALRDMAAWRSWAGVQRMQRGVQDDTTRPAGGCDRSCAATGGLFRGNVLLAADPRHRQAVLLERLEAGVDHVRVAAQVGDVVFGVGRELPQELLHVAVAHVGVRLRRAGLGQFARQAGRSEEHTSELQSLMRISYAVFCLKKKNNKN